MSSQLLSNILGDKHQYIGGVATLNKQTIVDQSNGIFEAEGPAISRVYCKACDETIENADTYKLKRHANYPRHKGIAQQYDQMRLNDELENFTIPFEAARCKYRSKHLFDFFSRNQYDFLNIRILEVYIENRYKYSCHCFCSDCEKEIPADLRSLQRHAERNDHKRDSKGYTSVDFNQDLCDMFLNSKYSIILYVQ